MNQHHDIKENGNASVRFWLKIASVIFAAWALMLPLGIWIVERTLDGVGSQVDKYIAKIEEDNRTNEITHRDFDKRLTTLESSHLDVLRRLAEVEAENRQEEELLNRMRKGRE
jgi:hypothetical protein